MRGEQVIVRAYGGRPLIRKIWDIQEGAVLIVEDGQFQLLINNDARAVGPIGFPKEDVFQFDPVYAKSMNKKDPDWSILKPFFK
jgi:hypothetical protein